MSRKKVLIIGAGISGLTAGIYAQMNGFAAEIFEMHNLPGGLCTAWNRKGYTIDGCIHWLTGIKSESPFYPFWQDVGALEDTQFHYHESFYRYEDGKGHSVTLYSDIGELEKHLLEVAPEDRAGIKKLVKTLKRLWNMPTPISKPPELYTARDGLTMGFQMLPYMKTMMKYSKITAKQYVERNFSSPLLKDALSQVMPMGYTAFAWFSNLLFFLKKDACFPLGGSLRFSQSLEKRFLDLGGKVNYQAKVEEILVQDQQAVGIKLTDGREFLGDYIIPAADGHSTIFSLLHGKFVNEKIKEQYFQHPTYTSAQVSLGVDYDLSQEPDMLVLKLDQPLTLGGIEQKTILLKHYCYDKSLAPEGKSIVVSMIFSEYDFWEEVAKDQNQYEQEKKRLAEAVIAALKKRFPATSGKVEMVDVATPLTYTKYTNLWQGAFMTWVGGPGFSQINSPRELPGLKNLFLAGQWAFSGGLPCALITGRWAVQRICKQEQ